MNEPPTAFIDGITPNPANTGENISFDGHGTDDGGIVAWSWRSDLSGVLSDQEDFNTDTLSLGTHTIYFKVQDNDGAWSNEVSETLEIVGITQGMVAVIDSIRPAFSALEGQEVCFYGHGEGSEGTINGWVWRSSMDGVFGDQANCCYSELSVGVHSIYFQVSDDQGEQSDYWSTPALLEIVNVVEPPVAVITSISPNPAANYQGTVLVGPGNDIVTFDASGSYYPDGSIGFYYWVSSIDGIIGSQEVFSLSSLTPGVHTISLTVMGNDEVASEETQTTLTIVDGLVLRPPFGDSWEFEQYMIEQGIQSGDPDDFTFGSDLGTVRNHLTGDIVSHIECDPVDILEPNPFREGWVSVGQYATFELNSAAKVDVTANMTSFGGTEKNGLYSLASTSCQIRFARKALGVWGQAQGGPFYPYILYPGLVDIDAWYDDWDVVTSLFLTFAGMLAERPISTLLEAIQVIIGYSSMGEMDRILAEGDYQPLSFIKTVNMDDGEWAVAFNIRAVAGASWILGDAKAARYCRLHNIVITESVGEEGFVVVGLCPIDLVLTDPLGREISQDRSEVPDGIYRECDFNGDGIQDDYIHIQQPMSGVYSVEVVPDSAALPSDSFTVVMEYNGVNIFLAENETIDQIQEHPFTVSTSNNPPDVPTTPEGSTESQENETVSFSTSTVDPESDQVYYFFDWGDGMNSGWLGPYASGQACEASHVWQQTGSYQVRAKATDENDPMSLWSDPLVVNVQELPYAGYLELLQAGPPDWAYRLHHVDGEVSQIVFTNFCEGTEGSIAGDAVVSWSMLSDGDGNDGDSIVFVASTPLTTGSIDTFWLSHPWCGDMIQWCVGDTCNEIDGPLPVELTSFEATAGDREVTLTWQTASETDNDHFEILRGGHLVYREDANNSVTGGEYSWTEPRLTNGVTYEYTLISVDIDGSREELATVSATPLFDAATITEYALHQNYPNPFNPATSITFDLIESGDAMITVYNPLGQKMATLINGEMPAGRHTINFNAEALPSGLYFYRMEAGDFTAVKKMILMK
ncbi:T9SS type A sorting domain-containing protein [bacterium]|nr:T9SS type A sorting domain-containing protein [bacterium]MBU1636949.1 T9SS type A sorting domain-containing protein [bacterium]